MPGHFEEAAGDDRGFMFFAQQLEESLGIAAMREAREDDRAGGRTKTFEVVARIEKGVEQSAIGGEQSAGALAKLFEMFEGLQGEALRGMRAGSGKQIVEEPHAAGEVRSGEDPATAQTAQAIDLREAAGDDERIFSGARDCVADGKAKRGGFAEEHLEIDFVDQDAHAGAKGQLADGL